MKKGREAPELQPERGWPAISQMGANGTKPCRSTALVMMTLFHSTYAAAVS